jgi:putative two-component system response regulator
MAENRRKSVEKMSLQMIRALANTIDAKDSYTNGHSTRVAKYSVMIAKKLGYEGKKLELLEYTALLHDIGKIGIPNEIINKPSRLTDEEYDIIKTHPGIGGKILEEITEIPDIAIGARYHHERFDGKGYPDKLSGEEIPEIARIIGVADAYDAMTSNRSYRDLLPQQVVRGEIEKGKNTQFDPAIADAMLSLIDEDISYTMHE